MFAGRFVCCVQLWVGWFVKNTLLFDQNMKTINKLENTENYVHPNLNGFESCVKVVAKFLHK